MVVAPAESASRRARVVVALSGGVDSSVAAALLARRGYDVVGVTLRLYDCQEGQHERSCCGLSGVAEARAAAGALSVPHYVIDGQGLFERKVLRYAWEEYAAGRTPNPCVACNDWMKFGLLYEQAAKLGASHVATGHHARVIHAKAPMGATGGASRTRLLRGRDRNKDQSYFLFSLSARQLRMSLFPIGELTKDEVRSVARELDLPNAERLESQDACIAQRGDLAEALRRRFDGERRTGLLRDTRGRVLGRHEGVHRFTIGQRKGLGVSLGRRAYVVAIDRASGDVIVGDELDLAAGGLEATGVSWLDRGGDVPIGRPLAVTVKIRYRHQPVVAALERTAEDRAVVRFVDPQRAVTPGQAVVFYHGEEMLGGGWIERALAFHRDTRAIDFPGQVERSASSAAEDDPARSAGKENKELLDRPGALAEGSAPPHPIRVGRCLLPRTSGPGD